MLRGYHPLTEIHRWNQLIVTLFALLSLLIVSAYVIYWPLLSGWESLLTLCCLLIPALVYVPILFAIRWDSRQLAKMRADLFQNQNRQGVFPPLNRDVSLPPLTLLTRFHYAAFIWPCIGLLLAVLGILAVQLPLWLPNPYAFPAFIWISLPALGTFFTIFGAISMQAFRRIVSEQYLLPQLEVDDQGISATYGPDTVRMAWRNVVYFALCESRTPRYTNKDSDLSIFELCDGENTINWDAHLQMKVRRPLLGVKEYQLLLDKQLPLFVSSKTHLPLLDLRAPMHQPANGQVSQPPISAEPPSLTERNMKNPGSGEKSSAEPS